MKKRLETKATTYILRVKEAPLVVLWLLVNVALPVNAAPPTIHGQTKDQAVLLYQQAAFSVIASGTGQLSYQWSKDGVPIPGATNDQIVIAQARFIEAGRYSVVVANAEGLTSSVEARLTILAPRAGDLDCSFASGESVSGSVAAMAVQADGKILLISDGTVRRLNSDGSTDHTFASGVAEFYDGVVTSIAVQIDGKIVLGGYQVHPILNFGFSCGFGVAVASAWRLNPDGSLDSDFENGFREGKNLVQSVALAGQTRPHETCPLGPVGRPASPIYSLVVQSDGKLLIGGSFSSIKGVGRTNIARLNSDGTVDSGFQNGLSGANGEVYSVALQADGKILIGGVFNAVNGVGRRGIARLNTDGTLDSGYVSEVYVNESIGCCVHSIVVQSDGRVLIGGFFKTVNGVPRGGIARLNADGSLDSGFQNGLSGTLDPVAGYDLVNAIAVQTDGKLLIGGAFTQVNGARRNKIARLNADGTLDMGYQNGLSGVDGDYSISVNSIAVRGDGKAVIAGNFGAVNGVLRSRIARLNPDGTLDTRFQNESAFTGFNVLPAAGAGCVSPAISALAVQSDDKVIAGGFFHSFNAVGRTNIARLNADGSLDAGFLNELAGIKDQDGYCGSPPPIYAMVPQSDGKLLLGGRFQAVHGVSRRGIARLNADGTLDVGFQNGASGVGGDPYAFGTVLAVAGQSDGKVVIGGAFTSVNGLSRTNIARLNPDGTLDSGFQDGLPGANFQGGGAAVNSVAVQRDGKVIIGGGFSVVNGVTRNCIARLNADGSLDNGFQQGLSGTYGSLGYGPVYSVVVQTDGRVIIGGLFITVNGVTHNCVARLNADGTLDTGFPASPFASDSSAFSLAIQRDGKVLIGGQLQTVSGENRSGIARLNADGTLDSGFISRGSGLDGDVRSIALQSDGSVIIAGGFTTVNGRPAPGIARLWGSADIPPHLTSLHRSGADVNLSWDALPNRTYRVQYKENLSVKTWTDLAGDVTGSASGTGSKADTTSGNAGQRFYRVVLLP